MNIVELNINDLIPYENNPRKNDEAVQYVANSIKEFGFKVPIVIDKDYVIVAGHTRYKASKQLGLEKVPCIIADDLTDEQIKAFRLADNKTGELAEWDIDLLDDELDDILSIDMEDFGFMDIEKGLQDDTYTNEVNIPQYDVSGESVTLRQCYDTLWSDELIEEIEQSNVNEEEKKFLIEAAKRHIKFNYRNIAEYYAQASPEMQKLMEKSALVIIDVEDAIKNGYAKLSDSLVGGGRKCINIVCLYSPTEELIT